MAAQAGPSRLRHGHASPNAVPPASREETELSNLVARLSIQDVDELESRQQWKGTKGPQLTDAQLALKIFAEDARSVIAFNNDRTLAMALSEAEPQPPVVYANQAASRSRPTTIRNAQALNTTQPQGSNRAQLDHAAGQTVSRNSEATWGEWFVSIINWFAEDSPTSPTSATPSTRLTRQNCVICQDPIRGGQIRAPCGHYYDIACVTDLFQSATRDESLFPPRCCRQPILLVTVRQHLTPALIALFNEKEKEFTTLKRVYCAKPSCSRFLGPQSQSMFGKVMTCPTPGCLTLTCRCCKAKVASGDPHWQCKVDEIDKQVLALGKNAGWARCPGCAQMIELQMGCYHMTCRCKTEFCYLCTARWKTCTCTQWDEQRLLVAAAERVDLQYRPNWHRGPQRDNPQILALRRMVGPTPNSRGDVAVRDEVNLRPAPLAEATHRAHHTTVAPPTQMLQPPRSGVTTVQGAVRSVRLADKPPHSVVEQPRHVPNPSSSVRDQLIRQAVEDLRVNHDCQHTKWSYRAGGGRCQTCYCHLPLYLFRCSGCQILACNRCRRNRL